MRAGVAAAQRGAIALTTAQDPSCQDLDGIILLDGCEVIERPSQKTGFCFKVAPCVGCSPPRRVPPCLLLSTVAVAAPGPMPGLPSTPTEHLQGAQRLLDHQPGALASRAASRGARRKAHARVKLTGSARVRPGDARAQDNAILRASDMDEGRMWLQELQRLCGTPSLFPHASMAPGGDAQALPRGSVDQTALGAICAAGAVCCARAPFRRAPRRCR
jgi:hypothetical protein